MSTPAFTLLRIAATLCLVCPGVRMTAAAGPLSGREILASLTAANDHLVDQTLGAESPAARPAARPNLRSYGQQILTLGAAYTHPLSRHHHAPALLPILEQAVGEIAAAQRSDGLWDAGNIASPPDSAFALKIIAKVQRMLVRDDHPATELLRNRLKALILKTVEGVRTGGVHTPNHRWAICSALAHVHALYPDERYIRRLDEWLAEGIDLDEDGQWAERSPNYTSDVNNPSLIDVALLLKRPELLVPVRRSLDASLFLFEPDGETEGVASRRQDQRAGARQYVWHHYAAYRTLAILDGNETYAAVARWIERDFLAEVGAASANMSSALTSLLAYPELVRDLPAAAPLPEDYTKVFPGMALARLKRGATTATVFGGSDWYAGLGHGSGLSTNPTFFKLRKGKAVLESVRMSPSFFATGFFYSQGLEVAEGRYVLSQELRVPYHLPLPKEHRRTDGQYALQPDMATEGVLGRYFSKMDFAHRPKQFVTLSSRVVVTERDGRFELAFDIGGVPGIPVTIELAFRKGGALAGVIPRTESGAAEGFDPGRNRGGPLSAADLANTFVFKEGYATYTSGGDQIKFGPGVLQRPPARMEGEALTWIGGSMKAEGDRVYLTGVTPFQHTLTIE